MMQLDFCFIPGIFSEMFNEEMKTHALKIFFFFKTVTMTTRQYSTVNKVRRLVEYSQII